MLFDPKLLTPVTDNDPTFASPVVTKLPPVMFPVATISPLVPKLPTLALPFTFSVPRVPTVVKLEVIMLDAKTVPVKLAALAVIATLAAAVN